MTTFRFIKGLTFMAICATQNIAQSSDHVSFGGGFTPNAPSNSVPSHVSSQLSSALSQLSAANSALLSGNYAVASQNYSGVRDQLQFCETMLPLLETMAAYMGNPSTEESISVLSLLENSAENPEHFLGNLRVLGSIAATLARPTVAPTQPAPTSTPPSVLSALASDTPLTDSATATNAANVNALTTADNLVVQALLNLNNGTTAETTEQAPTTDNDSFSNQESVQNHSEATTPRTTRSKRKTSVRSAAAATSAKPKILRRTPAIRKNKDSSASQIKNSNKLNWVSTQKSCINNLYKNGIMPKQMLAEILPTLSDNQKQACLENGTFSETVLLQKIKKLIQNTKQQKKRTLYR